MKVVLFILEMFKSNFEIFSLIENIKHAIGKAKIIPRLFIIFHPLFLYADEYAIRKNYCDFLYPEIISRAKIFLKNNAWITHYLFKGKTYEEINSFSYLIITDILADMIENYEDIFLIQKNVSFLFSFSDEWGNMRYNRNLPPDLDDSSLFIILLTDINFSYYYLCDFVRNIKKFFDGKLIRTWIGENFPWGKENPSDIHVNINVLRAYFKLSELCLENERCLCDSDVQEIVKKVFGEILKKTKDFSIFIPQFYYSNQFFILFFLIKLFEEVLPQKHIIQLDISELYFPCHLFYFFEDFLSDGKAETLSPLFFSSFLLLLSYCGFVHNDLNKVISHLSKFQDEYGGFPAEELYFDYPYDKGRKRYFSKFISTALVVYSLKKILEVYGCWKMKRFF